MKLALSIALALATLLYAIIKNLVPDFPITADQILQIIILILGALGVTVSEQAVRSWAVRRGFKGFMRK